ncbi:hypothetical protein [Labrenzia sp. PHM005]|uniref:hypothetical protein n=1 Tax=Labrenzia sp. PHM005 TaxID=2590016 RepID=UPI0011401B1F|nr:hypothetical protein [Labrenzia sp. PHM005]QDG78119.1 hypothetical protein FJ695_20880 [Labrenzia sp. PHM005]
MTSKSGKTKLTWPKLSGPHICASVGQQSLNLAQKALLGAAKMRGGKLDAAEITAVFEFLAVSQDMFDIFRTNYEACGKIHRKQSFVGANTGFFAMSVLRFLCFDVLRKTFESQINRTDAAWEIEFLQAFSNYICRTADEDFEDSLSAAYRRLAKENGSEITVMTIAHDPAIQEIVRKAVAKFPSEHLDFVNFSNTINKALSDKYETYGPSPIKVSEPVVERFFKALGEPSRSNYFRGQVLS